MKTKDLVFVIMSMVLILAPVRLFADNELQLSATVESRKIEGDLNKRIAKDMMYNNDVRRGEQTFNENRTVTEYKSKPVLKKPFKENNKKYVKDKSIKKNTRTPTVKCICK